MSKTIKPTIASSGIEKPAAGAVSSTSGNGVGAIVGFTATEVL
jgi:hypothetical protein